MTAQDRFDALERQELRPVGASGGKVLPLGRTLRDILANREMLSLLVRRDLKSRYKDSALGFVWTLARPLTQLAIYYFILGAVLGAARNVPQFAIYVFAGLTIYGLFSEIVSGGTASIVGNAGLIKKVYVPREVFPLASVGSAGFNFLIQLAILLIATFALGQAPFTPELAYAIPAVLLMLVWGTALGLLLAALNVYLRDVQYLVEVLLMLLMWASPIVYTWKMLTTMEDPFALPPAAIDAYTNNPITLAVLGFQRAFWIAGHDISASAPADLLLRMLIALAIGLVALIAAQRVFARLQGNFAQEL